jgi:hypothetical protein
MPDGKFWEEVGRLRWLEDVENDLRQLKLKKRRQGEKEENGRLSEGGSGFLTTAQN